MADFRAQVKEKHYCKTRTVATNIFAIIL